MKTEETLHALIPIIMFPQIPACLKSISQQYYGSWQAGESPQAGPTCIYRRYWKGLLLLLLLI